MRPRLCPHVLTAQFIGIEQEEFYCLLAEKRLELAERELAIQGYADGYFLERNTAALQRHAEDQVDQHTR